MSMGVVIKITFLSKTYGFSQVVKERFMALGRISMLLILLALLDIICFSYMCLDMAQVKGGWSLYVIPMVMIMWLMLTKKVLIEEWEKRIGIIKVHYQVGNQIICKEIPFDELQATKNYIHFFDQQTQEKISFRQQQLVEVRYSYSE